MEETRKLRTNGIVPISAMIQDKELLIAIGRLEGKVDMILNGQTEFTMRLNALDGRLRTVERRVTWLGAFAAGAGAFVGVVSSYITIFWNFVYVN